VGIVPSYSPLSDRTNDDLLRLAATRPTAECLSLAFGGPTAVPRGEGKEVHRAWRNAVACGNIAP
jgi:hypothetical protein